MIYLAHPMEKIFHLVKEKEYIQLFFHDNDSDSFLTTNNSDSSTFQNLKRR